MRSEPDFELLPQRPVACWRRLLLPVCAAVTLASVVWAAVQWAQYRSAQRALNAVQAEQSHTPAVITPTAPSYALEALKAAQLLQAPVDNWLRELERCQPDNAQTRELRVDVGGRMVTTSVEFTGSPEIVAWLGCLNAGLATPAWRMAQMSALDRPLGAVSTASWTVVLERRGS